MPQELLKRKEIVKKTRYYPRDPITTVFSAVRELLKFSDITGTSYTQNQAVKIAYVIINKAVKFGLEIRKWNRMLIFQKMGVGFKHFFGTAYYELQETTDITIQETGIHHTNIVRNVVRVIQEFLHKEQAPTKNPPILLEPNEHVANAVQITQHKLAAQLQ